MRRYPGRYRLLAIGLAALAGYVDAVGFLTLGGLFVSFMSGNSTRMAVGLAGGTGLVRMPAGLIAAFVMGVMLGTGIAAAAGSWRKPAVLAGVSLLLAGAFAAASAGLTYAVLVLLALAMGAENAVFQRDGEVSVGVTYMTGTLVKLGQAVTAALLGGPRFDWVPYLLLWAGLTAGAVTGALLFPLLGAASLLVAALAAAALTLVTLVLRWREKLALEPPPRP